MLGFLTSLDCFPKASDEYRVKTSFGAIVSIVSLAIIFHLLVGEFKYFQREEVVETLYVNTTRSTALTIDFDISFPRIPCALLSVDALDDSGQAIPDAVHELYKHRLDIDGMKHGEPERASLGETVRSETELQALLEAQGIKVLRPQDTKSTCGNCYGAGSAGQCCNSCQDVKDAYARQGWRFRPQGISQCSSEAAMVSLREASATEGGCEIYGRLSLDRVSGHFHVAPHRKLHETAQQAPQQQQQQQQIFSLLELISFTFDQFNVSHTIHTLAFGEQFPGLKTPLEGATRRVLDTHGMHQYYVKVVPVQLVEASGAVRQSNSYSVTEYMSHLAPGSGRGLPGVYFYYEVSPIVSRIETKRRSLLSPSFLASLCALLGGVFSVAALVDMLLTHAWRSCSKGVIV